MTNSLLSKHLGKGTEINIEGETYTIEPLDIESLPLFFKLMKAFSGANENDSSAEAMLKNINDDGLNAVKEVVSRTLKLSFPTEPEDTLKKFGMKYINRLLPVIINMNLYNNMDKNAQRKAKIIDRLKKK